jgi:shikimate 5-dehydrogenase
MKQHLPFKNKLMPVVSTVKDLKDFLKGYEEYFFCLYLANKDREDWQKSTSRRYMNQVLPGLIYLPVNIQKDDYDSLRQVYKISEQSPQIIAINQTQPHKSNPVTMDWFKDEPNLPANIDAIVKDKSGKLKPFDLNGPSFVGWFTDEVTSFEDKTVIVVGIGGVGEPIVRRIVKDKPLRLFMIDPANKSYLVEEFEAPIGMIHYFPDFEKVNLLPDLEQIILINAAGKEGASDQTGVYGLLEKYRDRNYFFVDLRPHLEIEIVEKAKELGWQAYTGYGMNARNDYELLSKIAELINVTPPTFEDFKQVVKSAS